MSNRIFLLDNSGSMYERIDDAIGGFNSFLDEQKNEPGTMSLYTFNHKLECVYKDIPIEDAKHLTKDDYHTSGNTALYDAMGTIIKDHEEGVLVVLTDGQENSSTTYTKAHVKDLVAASKLRIIYAGVDLDDAKDMGIKNTLYYNGANTPETCRVLSSMASQPVV